MARPHGAVQSRQSSTGDGTQRTKPHASSQRQIEPEADGEKRGTGATRGWSWGNGRRGELVWSISFIWLVSFVWFIWLPRPSNQTN